MFRIKTTSIIVVLAVLSMTISCNRILDQPPRDAITQKDFFKNANQLHLAINTLYDKLIDGPNVFFDDEKSDNILRNTVPQRIAGTRKTPTARGSGGWNWKPLRQINWIIQNADQVEDKEAASKYKAMAKWFRAYFYFKKLARFGDVPWYSKVLQPNDSALYKPRDPRTLVMDSILTDLNYAIKYAPGEKKLYTITKYTAMILKARVALFGGTYREYHHLGPYKKLLQEAASAAKKLMDSGAYTLYKKGGKKAYGNLFGLIDQIKTETILAENYKQGLKMSHMSYDFTAPTYHLPGMTQDMVNVYLMTDGSRFTDQSGYKTMGYYKQMQNRDPRLTQSTAGPNFVLPGESERAPVKLSFTVTGYRIIKGLQPKSQWCFTCSYNDIIIFRYAEALLIYAEAKAELGTLTQHDLDISINKLRNRVGMPHLKLVWANAHPDPYLEQSYPNVGGANKGVIFEIRRERRVELFDEGHRWNDLMRWADGQKLNQPMVGMYFPDLGSYDFNNDGTPDVYVYRGDDSGAPAGATASLDVSTKLLRDPLTGKIGGNSGNIVPHPNLGHFDQNRDYLYPIPIEALVLNPNLEQNPGWETP